MALIPVGGVSKHRIAHLAVAADIFLHLSAYECEAFDPPRHKKSCPSLTDSDPCFAEKEGFEPPVPLPVHRISSAARSTTLALLLSNYRSKNKRITLHFNPFFETVISWHSINKWSG